MPFKKGQPRIGGRKKGTPNKATIEVKEFARALFANAKGQATLVKKFEDGVLEPEVLKVLLYYAFGKPPQPHDVSLSFDHEGYLAGMWNKRR